MRAKWPIKSGAAAIAFIVIMVACQDPGLGPDDEKAADSRVSALAPSVVGAEATDTVFTTFMTRPWVPATFYIAGVHKITFPAQSVCDPAVTRYGPTEWDKPCRPATQPVRIRAKSWTDGTGHPRVQFSPKLRFVPTTQVTLYLKDKRAATDPSYNILWCVEGGSCINEAVRDPSLATRHAPRLGFIFRRIKHFSGYNVSLGRQR